jgi:iron complex transport system substrate-binding protein
MRICSFVPTATEILFALGLDEEIVGVTHECLYPPHAANRLKVVRTTLDSDGLGSAAIDRAVRTAIRAGRSLYRIDPQALKAAQPDLIIGQSLCDVCAAGGHEVAEALRVLPGRPEVLTLHPHTIREAMDDIRLLGEVTGRRKQARALLEGMQRRLAELKKRLGGVRRHPRVFCMEWFEPPMACGHWVPEMVALAGGREVLGRRGRPSRYVSWEQIAGARPDVLVLMPCGFSIERARGELPLLTREPQWAGLPAVLDRRVFLVDGPAYFNGSGPRLIDGIELLAGLFHPGPCGDLVPSGAAEPWRV